jgi:hypothetical protein
MSIYRFPQVGGLKTTIGNRTVGIWLQTIDANTFVDADLRGNPVGRAD